jgi:hypothetical protein
MLKELKQPQIDFDQIPEYRKEILTRLDRAIVLFFDRCLNKGYSICRVEIEPKILISLNDEDLNSIKQKIPWDAPLNYKYPQTIEIIKNKLKNDLFKIENLDNIAFMILVPKLGEDKLFYYHLILGFDHKFKGKDWKNTEPENGLIPMFGEHKAQTEFGLSTKSLLDDLNLESGLVKGVYRFDPGYNEDLIFFDFEYFFSLEDDIFNDVSISKAEITLIRENKNNKIINKQIRYKKLFRQFITWNKYSFYYTAILADIINYQSWLKMAINSYNYQNPMLSEKDLD